MRKFLLIGRTGVGKSSFVNATFGVQLASTSAFEACTEIVEYFSYNTPFGDICLIDTPGLAEDNVLRDKSYLQLISRSVKTSHLDAVLYISRLDDTRLRPDEKRTLILLTQYLGASIWNKAWLILTFAASVERSRLQDVSSHRIEQIQNFLKETTAKDSNNVPFISFQKCLLIDNVVSNWYPGAKLITWHLTN